MLIWYNWTNQFLIGWDFFVASYNKTALITFIDVSTEVGKQVGSCHLLVVISFLERSLWKNEFVWETKVDDLSHLLLVDALTLFPMDRDTFLS